MSNLAVVRPSSAERLINENRSRAPDRHKHLLMYAGLVVGFSLISGFSRFDAPDDHRRLRHINSTCGTAFSPAFNGSPFILPEYADRRPHGARDE
jgi:hypothetical protein